MTGSLAALKNAVIDEVAVGQWLANLRKEGGLGANPERAAERRRALEAIDPDWSPRWPVDWQRHYAAARTLLGKEQRTAAVLLPGVTVNGCDVGTWATRQQNPAVWNTLLPEQRARLEPLGITPPAPAPEETAAPSTVPVSAFERGIAALTQYQARTGSVTVARGHVERLNDGTEIRLGVFVSNHKSRRGKLTPDKLRTLASLGLEWADHQ
nr:helicase associated domain-containing protein [uncultured Streptomyces sp.]